MKTTLRASPTAAASVRARLFTRLKMVDVLQLPERDVVRMIKTLEEDPLFQRLMGLEDARSRVVRRQRYPRAQLSGSFYELREDLKGAPDAVDVQGLLDQRREVVDLIRSIGRGNFERHFLYQESPLSRREIAAACGITEAQAREVFDFLLKFSAEAEFFHPSALEGAPAGRPFCLGRIEGDESAGFDVAFYSPHLSRGRYAVDHDAWQKLRAGDAFSTEERRKASALLHQVELINMRADNFHRILREGMEAQRAFFQSRQPERKRTLSLREAARRLGVSSSTVCRAVAGHSVVLPWGQEVWLAQLFPQKKEVLQEVLERHLEDLGASRDGEVQRFLLETYQLRVPRRTVNYWRQRMARRAEAVAS